MPTVTLGSGVTTSFPVLGLVWYGRHAASLAAFSSRAESSAASFSAAPSSGGALAT